MYTTTAWKDTKDRTGIALIAYAIPGTACFYMVVQDGTTKVREVFASLQNVTTRLEVLPESIAAVFGVSLDNQIFRAVRSSAAAFCGIPFLRLLDTGEVLAYEETMPLFELPEYYQKLPPFAVRCNLVCVSDEPSCKDFSKYLGKNMYEIKQFKVCSRKKSTLNVSLARVPRTKLKGIVEPFRPDATPEYKISEKSLTQEQLDILYEEVNGTTNAMKAMMGFVPKDDQTICPFYDPKIEGCFKGSRCRLRHEAKDPDGWTKDRTFHKLKIRAQLVEPQVGQVLEMVPTAIVSVEEFYGQLYSERNIKDLVEMQSRLNDPTVVAKLRPMDHTPYAREYVLAPFWQDGRWYRAEVTEYIDDEMIRVFYLDYGNKAKVRIDDLRLWDDSFDYVPFQAIHCRIANVHQREDTKKTATTILKNAILEKIVSVEVLDIRSIWEVYLFDTTGNDIGQLLVDQQLAHLRQPIVFSDKQGLVPA
ncbi:tudor domain-containing protein 6 isoform X4 [Toxorhynchites rutilus septentrionalis]|uniref:tudor domain-containing protein 6 isoform X4 n=1 Tax=Toxorhynchites rutilus septentrionalis TaxID=329112 RepID=UPI0024798CBC|nr:tudor domain-containing protein 6 isoform X4 [Toxorhynchites rutilus septentrionalis]